jgi:indolepyruvate ferredoxin oxidoreductase
MKVDPRFMRSEGPEVFTGNELLLKGALEASGGTHLLAGYPGSPVAGFFDAMAHVKDLLNEKGIRAIINNNEALAAAALNGSQLAACRTMIVMKSVGVHVAADALAMGNLAGANPRGGAIVVYGDDPWSDSTQTPADSRFISKHLHIPTFEPSNIQEVKDFVDLCFRVSAASELYAGYVLTTNLADGGGTVQCRPNQYPAMNTRRPMELSTADIDLEKYVLLPPKTWTREALLPRRFARAIEVAGRLGLNRIDYPRESPAPIGFVTSGLAHGYLLSALAEMGILGEAPILKFGMSYPIDDGLLRRLAGMARRIVVVEERRGFLEEQVSEAILRDRQAGLASGQAEVWGKHMPDGLAGLPATRGLHPSILIEVLGALWKHVAASSHSAATQSRSIEQAQREIDASGRTPTPALPARQPTFCPGCPHRDSANVCLDIRKAFADPAYMKRAHKSGPVDMVFHGDTGCYTMLMYPPNTPLMHNYSGMGLGGGTGAGLDPFITNKQAVFMGDSTFFHSGQLAISQAIKLSQDITFVILDNRTTAMTGHQPTPGVEYDILGNATPVQDIEEALRGIATGTSATIVRADPQQRDKYRRLLERTFLAGGVKVIIADKECGITRTRRRRRHERSIARRKGFLPVAEHMNINPEICRFCLACVETTGCPGLKHTLTDYGRRMDTDLSWCVSDGACQRLGACDSFERVTVMRKRPPRSRLPELGLDGIPEPQRQSLAGGSWRCCVAGFGGMGIGVTSSVLVRAGNAEGYDVRFVDKKGLAIRNGGVTSQILFNASDQPLDPIIPFGKADLLVGLDILEAARALDPRGRMRVASKERTAAVVNTDKVATISGLLGLDDFDPDGLEDFIRRHTRGKDFLARNISHICEKYLGTKLYANIMMLGFAFQKGLIPVSMHSMAWAIKDTIHTDLRKNLYAFNMGRKLVLREDLFQGAPQRADWQDVLEEKCRHTVRRHWRGRRLADQLRELAAASVSATAALGPEMHRAFVVRLYDCMRWGGMPHARQYAAAVAGVFARDSADFGYAATRAVLHNLATAMLIKDAFFKAELSTSPEKYARDREKYNVNPAQGDRIRYRHFWHPRVRLGRWEWTGQVVLRDWMLRWIRRSRWMRKVLPAGRYAADRRALREYLARAQAFAWKTPREYQSRLMALSGAPCMNCANPRCREAGCPLACDIPRCGQLALQDRWREAADLLHAANNFPEFTSIVCPALCQDACKQGLTGYEVQIQHLEREIVERAFREGWVAPQPAKAKTGRKVAVVGSGPAGLAAAQQLARDGHAVTVFDKEAAPGGLLRYGIPPHRLEKAIVDRRLDQLRAEGVEFCTGVHIGRHVAGEALRKNFDAVLLATGAGRSRDLPIPGREKKGIVLALDFLREQSGGADSQPARSLGDDAESAKADEGRYEPASGEPGEGPDVKGKIVAVIGGGLTGEDCVQAALLAGAKEVHQFEILPRDRSSARPHGDGPGQAGRYMPAEEESEQVTRRWAVATKAFGGSGQQLGELRAVSVQWGNSPRGPVMTELPETEFRMKVDLAVLALGYEPAVEPDLAEQMGLEADPAGRLQTDGCQTAVPGVFVAGDLAGGPAYVAAAIASGRKAAEKIGDYLAAGTAQGNTDAPRIEG